MPWIKRTSQPPASGTSTLLATAPKSAAVCSPRPSAPTAQPRRLATGCAPASARCVAPLHHAWGLRPALPQAQHSAALRAQAGLAPLQWPLPRGPRSCSSLRLAGFRIERTAHPACVAPLRRAFSWWPPAIRLGLPLSADRPGPLRARRHPAQAPTIPPPRRSG